MACINIHQIGSEGEGSDHLQVIKFWPSSAPRKGFCGGVKIFGSTLLQPALSVCVYPSAFCGLCCEAKMDMSGYLLFVSLR